MRPNVHTHATSHQYINFAPRQFSGVSLCETEVKSAFEITCKKKKILVYIYLFPASIIYLYIKFKFEMLYKLKLILAGDAAVGKTALVTRYTTGEMSPEYDATIGVGFAMKLLDIPPRHGHSDEMARVKLHIWDTAGQETFRCITTAYFRGAAGAIIVYDASSQSGLRDASRWVKDVQKYSPHAKIVLAGNKVDKGYNALDPVDDTLISPTIVGHFKVSAKEGTNVDAIFQECTQHILESVMNGETDLKNSGVEITGYDVRNATSINGPDENVCLIECPSCTRKKREESCC